VEHRKHIVRLLIILAVLVPGFVVARSLLIPESFGKYGHYRGDNVEEQMNLPLVYQEAGFCEECHETQYGSWKDTGHATVNCEVCHGHWEIHNEQVKTMTADKSNNGCVICHLKLTGRPEEFPQIASFDKHMIDVEMQEEGMEECLECHDPHEPL